MYKIQGFKNLLRSQRWKTLGNNTENQDTVNTVVMTKKSRYIYFY